MSPDLYVDVPLVTVLRSIAFGRHKQVQTRS